MQTDTTVGFVSQESSKLYKIKSRDTNKPFIKVYPTLKECINDGYRIPNNMKNIVRRSKKTTFIIKNRAFRVAQHNLDSQILRDTKWCYSTSANESGKNFDIGFCQDKADIIIQDKYGLYENTSSKLFKINNTKRVKIR